MRSKVLNRYLFESRKKGFTKQIRNQSYQPEA